jgi:hypothetical protein
MSPVIVNGTDPRYCQRRELISIDPFDVKLLQLGHPPKNESDINIKSGILISFSTLNALALRECVYIWNLPVSAMQRKMSVFQLCCHRKLYVLTEFIHKVASLGDSALLMAA